MHNGSDPGKGRGGLWWPGTQKVGTNLSLGWVGGRTLQVPPPRGSWDMRVRSRGPHEASSHSCPQVDGRDISQPPEDTCPPGDPASWTTRHLTAQASVARMEPSRWRLCCCSCVSQKNFGVLCSPSPSPTCQIFHVIPFARIIGARENR